MAETFIEASRKSWNSDGSMGHINAGSLQRIAAATELMAQSYSELIDQRDRYKRSYEVERSRVIRLKLSVSALKGVITKMKKDCA